MKLWFPHSARKEAPVVLSRRSFLIGALATPVIVRAASLMPVKALELPIQETAVQWGDKIAITDAAEVQVEWIIIRDSYEETRLLPVWRS